MNVIKFQISAIWCKKKFQLNKFVFKHDELVKIIVQKNIFFFEIVKIKLKNKQLNYNKKSSNK